MLFRSVRSHGCRAVSTCLFFLLIQCITRVWRGMIIEDVNVIGSEEIMCSSSYVRNGYTVKYGII